MKHLPRKDNMSKVDYAIYYLRSSVLPYVLSEPEKSNLLACVKELEDYRAAEQRVQADGLPALTCAECGETTVMNHKESCSKR